MRNEKSCGAVVFYKDKRSTKVLLIKHINGGHWSFPKGHVERGENERQTALREIREETGLSVKLDTSYRKVVTYSPRRGVIKDVVYFVALSDTMRVKPQASEISQIKWVDISVAMEYLTHQNDKQILSDGIAHFLNSRWNK